MPTRRLNIIKEALRIIESKQGGITLGQLSKKIKEKYPEYEESYIRSVVMPLPDYRFEEIYRPRTGWFCHKNINNNASLRF